MTLITSGYKRYRVNIDDKLFALVRNDPEERSTEIFEKPDKPLLKVNFIEKDGYQLKRYLSVYNAGVRHGKRVRPRVNRRKKEIQKWES